MRYLKDVIAIIFIFFLFLAGLIGSTAMADSFGNAMSIEDDSVRSRDVTDPRKPNAGELEIPQSDSPVDSAIVDTLKLWKIQPSTEGVRRCLQLFVPSDERMADLYRLVRDLDDDRYTTREAAYWKLIAEPLLPPTLLHNVFEEPSPEVVVRFRLIMKKRTQRDPQSLLSAVLQLIEQSKLKGLAPEILAVLDFYRATPRELAAHALAATATPDDLPLLRKAMESDVETARYAALGPVLQFSKDGNSVDLSALLRDPDEGIRLAAALALADRGDHTALGTLVGLLKAESGLLRYKAIHSLRYLTEQQFEYDPWDDSEGNKEPINRWKKWVEENGATCRLRFPVVLPRGIPMLADANLSMWKIIMQGSEIVVDKVASQLSCAGGTLTVAPNVRCYLRSRNAYKNYRLRYQWRFTGAGLNDAGLMLYMTGVDSLQGNGLEVQLHMGNAGDLYKIGGFRANVKTGIRSRMADSSERPVGQWNDMEILVRDGKLEIKVNDVVQNRATDMPTEPRSIGIRLEGAAMEFREMLLLPLD